jgi:hypothetical protein
LAKSVCCKATITGVSLEEIDEVSYERQVSALLLAITILRTVVQGTLS